MSRKPWLLITEFMKYKDLGGLLIRAKRANIGFFLHELLFVSFQIARALLFLDEVLYLF